MQSQTKGFAYLFAIGLPSVFSASKSEVISYNGIITTHIKLNGMKYMQIKEDMIISVQDMVLCGHIGILNIFKDVCRI